MTYPIDGRAIRPFNFAGSPDPSLFSDYTNANGEHFRTWKAGTPLYLHSYGPGFYPFTYMGYSNKTDSLATITTTTDEDTIKNTWLPRTSSSYDSSYGKNDKFIRRFNSYIPEVYWTSDSDKALKKFMDSISIFYDGMNRDLDLLQDFNYKEAKNAWLPYLLRSLGWMSHTTDPDFWRWQARYAFSLFRRKGQDRELANLLKLLKVDFSYLEKWRDENGELTEYAPETIQYYTDSVPSDSDKLYFNKLYEGTCVYDIDIPYSVLVDSKKNYDINELVSVDDPFYLYDSNLTRFSILANTETNITVDNREQAFSNSSTKTLNIAQAKFPVDGSSYCKLVSSGSSIILTGSSLPVGHTSWPASSWSAGDYSANLTIKIASTGVEDTFNNLPISKITTYAVPTTPTDPLTATVSSGGSLVAGTYSYKYTCVPLNNTLEGESSLCTEALVETITVNSTITLTFPTKDYATYAYNIYRTDVVNPSDSDYDFLYAAAPTDTGFVDDGTVVLGPAYSNNYDIPYFMIDPSNIYGPLTGGEEAYIMSVTDTDTALYIPAPTNWSTDLWTNGASIAIVDRLNQGNLSSYYTITRSYVPTDILIKEFTGSFTYLAHNDIYWISPEDTTNVYPRMRRIRVNGADSISNTFTKYSGGLVTISGNVGISNAKVKILGTDYYTTSDSTGAYSLSVAPSLDPLIPITYTVVPFLEDTVFTPLTIDVDIYSSSVTGQNFTNASGGTSRAISGTITTGGVGLENVLVTMGFKETFTDSLGTYTFSGIPNNATTQYTISASIPGYTLSADLTVTVNGADSTGNDFTAVVDTATYTVSGNLLNGTIDWTTNITPIYETRFTASSIANGIPNDWLLSPDQLTDPNVQMYITDTLTDAPVLYVVDMDPYYWNKDMWENSTLINAYVPTQYYTITKSGFREVVVDTVEDSLTFPDDFVGAIILRKPKEGSYFICRESGLPTRNWYGKEAGTYRIPAAMGDQLYCLGTILSPTPYSTHSVTHSNTLDIFIKTPDQGFDKRISLYIEDTLVNDPNIPISSNDGTVAFYTYTAPSIKVITPKNITLIISPYDSKDTHISSTTSVSFYLSH